MGKLPPPYVYFDKGLWYLPKGSLGDSPSTVVDDEGMTLFRMMGIYGPPSLSMNPSQVEAFHRLRARLIEQGGYEPERSSVRQVLSAGLGKATMTRRHLAVLEFGCGGNPLELPGDVLYVGVDIDQGALRTAARKQPHRLFITPDKLQSIPLGSIDVITGAFSFHFPVSKSVSEALVNKLKPTGSAFFNLLRVDAPAAEHSELYGAELAGGFSPENEPEFFRALRKAGHRLEVIPKTSLSFDEEPSGPYRREHGILVSHWSPHRSQVPPGDGFAHERLRRVPEIMGMSTDLSADLAAGASEEASQISLNAFEVHRSRQAYFSR